MCAQVWWTRSRLSRSVVRLNRPAIHCHVTPSTFVKHAALIEDMTARVTLASRNSVHLLLRQSRRRLRSPMDRDRRPRETKSAFCKYTSRVSSLCHSSEDEWIQRVVQLLGRVARSDQCHSLSTRERGGMMFTHVPPTLYILPPTPLPPAAYRLPPTPTKTDLHLLKCCQYFLTYEERTCYRVHRQPCWNGVTNRLLD